MIKFPWQKLTIFLLVWNLVSYLFKVLLLWIGKSEGSVVVVVKKSNNPRHLVQYKKIIV